MTNTCKGLTKIVRAGLYLLIYFEVAILLFGMFSERTLMVDCRVGVLDLDVLSDAGGWVCSADWRNTPDLRLHVTADRTEELVGSPHFGMLIDTYDTARLWEWSAFGMRSRASEYASLGEYGTRHQALLLPLIGMVLMTYMKPIMRRVKRRTP